MTDLADIAASCVPSASVDLAAGFDGLSPVKADRELVLLPPFQHESGHCWMVRSGGFGQGDSPAGTQCSPIMLFEDGVPLTPPHCGHDDIRRLGQGRFSHWQGWFWFSASDNSDPNANGKRYTARIDWDALFTHHARHAVVQLRRYLEILDIGEADLSSREADLSSREADLKGKTIVEVAPGPGAGTLYAFAALGARAIGLDPYPQPWRPEWRAPFLAVLAREMTANGLTVTEESLTCATANAEFLQLPLEQAGDALAGQADFIASTAVLEHVADPESAMAALARISRPGALNVHIVDCRDHRDPLRPLEFLLLDDAAYEDANREYYRYVIGNRMTMPRWAALARRHGFKLIRQEALLANNSAYLDDFLPRLRQAQTRFRSWDESEFTAGIGALVLERRP